MREHDIKAAILRAFGGRPGLRLFNNPVGEAWMGKTVFQPTGDVLIRYPHKVRFGLATGSSDLIGFRSIIVTSSMVGQRIAQFAAIETKGPAGRATKEQENFLHVVADFGGIAILAKSNEDVERGLKKHDHRNDEK